MSTLDDLLATGVWRDIVSEFGTPLVIVDVEIIRERCRALKAAFPEAQFLYAPKANYNPWIVREIVAEGFGIDAVSPLEIKLALSVGVPPADIVYVENRHVTGGHGHCDRSRCWHRGWGRWERWRDIARRDRGPVSASGSMATSVRPSTPLPTPLGPKSKFGIHSSQIAETLGIATAADVKVTRLQQHIGSNWLDPDPFLAAARSLCEAAQSMPDVEALDFGRRASASPIELTIILLTWCRSARP